MTIFTKHYTACPVVRRESITFVEHGFIGGRHIEVPFTREILWVRESSATIHTRHKGHDIDTHGTFNDFYGFLSSFKGAVTDDAKRIAKALAVDIGAAFTVDVDFVIDDVPMMEIPPEHPHYEKPREGYKRALWQAPPYGSRWVIKGGDERLERREVASAKALWSSGKHELGVVSDDAAALLAQWELEAQEVVP